LKETALDLTLRRTGFARGYKKMERKIQGTGRRGRRLEQLLDDVKVKTVYWNLKETALDLTLRRTGFARGYVTCRKQRHGLFCAKGTFIRFAAGSA